jgi:hypothetical protein
MVKYSLFILILIRAVVAADFDLSQMDEVKARLNNSVNAPGENCIECEHDKAFLDDSNKIEL